MFIDKCYCCATTERIPCGNVIAYYPNMSTSNTHGITNAESVGVFKCYGSRNRFVVADNNNIFIDTGDVLGTKNYFFVKPAGTYEIKVTVYGPYRGWEYILCCPVIETCNNPYGDIYGSLRVPSNSYIMPYTQCTESSCFSAGSTVSRIKSTGYRNDCTIDTGYDCCKDCGSIPWQPDINKCCKSTADHTDDNPSLCCQNDCCYTDNQSTGIIGSERYTRGKFTDNGLCCPDDLPYCQECEADDYIRHLVTGDWALRRGVPLFKEKSCRDEYFPFMQNFYRTDSECYGIPHTYTFDVPKEECVVYISFGMLSALIVGLNVTINGENYDYRSLERGETYSTTIYICKPKDQTQIEISLNSLSVVYPAIYGIRYDDIGNTCLTIPNNEDPPRFSIRIENVTNGCPCTNILGGNPLP